MDNNPTNTTFLNIFNPQKKILPRQIIETEVETGDTELIRFEEKKECWVWARPDDICFVKSADHYVKSLVNCGEQKKWLSRHCTLKELLDLLPHGNFIRLNKFYLLNRIHFSHINENEKLLYFDDNFSIPVPHRISPYLRHLLKSSYT